MIAGADSFWKQNIGQIMRPDSGVKKEGGMIWLESGLSVKILGGGVDEMGRRHFCNVPVRVWTPSDRRASHIPFVVPAAADVQLASCGMHAYARLHVAHALNNVERRLVRSAWPRCSRASAVARLESTAASGHTLFYGYQYSPRPRICTLHTMV